MSKYKNIQWVIQQNLSSNDVLAALKAACQQLEIDYVEVEIIPFLKEIPYFPREKRSIFYGSISFNNNIYADKDLNEGLFFNEAFSMENYMSQWGEYMLNYGAKITSFKELMTMDYAPDKLLFIRPDDDVKTFAGDVKAFADIETWYASLLTASDNIDLGPDTKILVAEPFNIKAEWRLWVVNKKVVAASKYREFFRLKKERGCPPEVLAFAEARCAEYVPTDVFVMDICLCGDAYYIVESGCFNGAGFYNADINAIVTAVSDYFV